VDLTKLPFSMLPVGWFQIGWSAEIGPGDVKPLRYFGKDLVAFRGESGALSVFDAHCPHLGAHLGHGGKVIGDCIQCPYHGWQWRLADGGNALIPEQDNTINARLRQWHVLEQNDAMFIWHDPTDTPPRWGLPDIFASFDAAMPADGYYPPFGNSARKWPSEEVHPQIAMENAVDSAHFVYTHQAPVSPVLLGYDIGDSVWTSRVGFRNKHTRQVALELVSKVQGVGTSFTTWTGSYNYRLLFSVTPIDDRCSDIFYTIWYPRLPGDTGNVMPAHVKDEVERRFLNTVNEDLLIWRTQVYVPHPIHARADMKTYPALRKWQKRFYDLPAETPAAVREPDDTCSERPQLGTQKAALQLP